MKAGSNGRESIPNSQAGELFNLKEDIGETINAAGKHPEIVEELTAMMKDYISDLSKNSRKIGAVLVSQESLELLKKKKDKKKKKKE